MPVSLLEALASGCVPICTPVGGIKNIIQDGVTGYLSENTEEEAYYKAIKKYLAAPKAIETKKLTSLFNEKYSIEKSAKQHELLYGQAN
jgi:glycosyltransferase involved in cell wall biosynthesis